MSKLKFLNKEQSKLIFENGFVNFDYPEMCAFSRYAFMVEKWSKGKIEKYIRAEFFKKGLNLVLLREQIHKSVLSAKYDFLERDTIIITKEEITKISKLKNRKFERGLFSILVFAKRFGTISGKNYYFWQDLDEILSKSKIDIKGKELEDFISIIGMKFEYVNAVVRKTKLSWRVSFSSDDGDTFCEISDFNNFMDLLPKWCVECRGVVTGKSLYCLNHNTRWERKKRTTIPT